MSRIHVKVDGVEHDIDDLTLNEIASFERATGETWRAMNPFRSAVQCQAVLVELYARTRARSEAEKVVGNLSGKAAAEHLVLADEDDDRPVEHHDGVPVVDPKPEPDGTETT